MASRRASAMGSPQPSHLPKLPSSNLARAWFTSSSASRKLEARASASPRSAVTWLESAKLESYSRPVSPSPKPRSSNCCERVSRSVSRAARRSASTASVDMAARLPACGPRVGCLVGPPEPLGRDLGVHLRGRDGGVSEQLLHHPDVGAVVEHVGSTRMAHHV